MPLSRTRLLLVPVLAALAAMAFLAPAAGAAGPTPTLASTAQSKDFVAYVRKLDGLAGKPTTGAKKAEYEALLTKKRDAVAAKANALFNSAVGAAFRETNGNYKRQALIVRRNANQDIADLEDATDDRLDRLSANYQSDLADIAANYSALRVRLFNEISSLRTKKAKAKGKQAKARIQEQITAVIKDVGDSRAAERQARTNTTSDYLDERASIRKAEATQEAQISADADKAVRKLARRWKRAYNNQKARLQAKRQTQLTFIAGKLAKGRADIASMTAIG